MSPAKPAQAAAATGTVRVSRVFKAPPERIWKCFTDPDAYAKWLPPHGFTGHVHHMDAKAGGTFRMSFSTIDRRWSQTFGGKYVEMKPYERLVHTNRFETDDPAMQGEMLTTITLRPVAGGTEVTAVQEHVPKPAAEGAPIGWSQSLDNLAALCEQELPF
jgi:uncharacterized protein YndB with AHSA1/START domain